MWIKFYLKSFKEVIVRKSNLSLNGRRLFVSLTLDLIGDETGKLVVAEPDDGVGKIFPGDQRDLLAQTEAVDGAGTCLEGAVGREEEVFLETFFPLVAAAN